MAVLGFILQSVIPRLRSFGSLLAGHPGTLKSQVNDNFNDTGKSGGTICSAGCSFIFMLHVN